MAHDDAGCPARGVSHVEAKRATNPSPLIGALSEQERRTRRRRAPRSRTAEAFGGLDILINNAGDLIARYRVEESTDEFFDQQVATNIQPVFAACRAAIPLMRQRGSGVIVNVSSVAARTGGGGGSSLYASAKAFVATFTRALAKELAPERIRVNAVSPGVIDTPMQDRTTPREQLQVAVGQIPLRRIGVPEECAGTFLYLARRRRAATSQART